MGDRREGKQRKMEKYRFDEHTRAAFERSVVPIGVYQMVEGRVVTLIASDGLCKLFGYKDRIEAMEKMDSDMYWNVHPDDLKRVEEAAAGFIMEDQPYNLVCRVMRENGYRLIHTRGEHVITETGERLAVIWYIDEGAVVLNAKAAEDEEKIEYLKASIQSLFNNMPALSFSKDMVTGIYLACNQAFADYAGRKMPADIIGLTDYEIFDPVTAAHFVANDKKALSMDEPYIFFEEAQDASGNPRHFQTTKLKFIDETGRLCLLGMSMDVTEVMQVKKENEEAKAAYQEALNTSTIYENIVEALSGDFFNLFYVDVETGDYIEYGSRTREGQRETEKHGRDFFTEYRKNAENYLYEEDRDTFIETLEKERLLGEIKKHGTFNFYYRLMIKGVPTYVSMKSTYISGDDRYIIIGVSNVDSQVKDRMAAERAEEVRKSYVRLSALAGNLVVLYFIDPENGRYTEFSSTSGYEELGIAKQGTDFFRTSYENGVRMVHEEDQALFRSQFSKENILSTIERDGVFMMDYRLMIGESPTYVRLKAAKVEENGKPLLIVGLLNEDVQIRQEQEYARKLSAARTMATIDSLTGVKNKHAYVQWEEKINTKIEKGVQEPFAVVVCDVNSLKAVNDLYGHKEGDACIRNACAKICSIFSHSPVFRIGGDEFVVLLSGEDYNRRADLIEEINAIPGDTSKILIGETISAGMVEYNKKQHTSVLSVFEEADRAMYERKQFLKQMFPSDDHRPGSHPVPEELPVTNIRKCILIADDIESNREILGDLLEEDYDILYAADGLETLEILHIHKDEISLVLLDLYMPNMTGRDVITRMQVDEELRAIPVIILTVDQEAELDCLRIGAMDFIPKPYSDIEIVKARIGKCIELSEDRDQIRHTERDKLTGLLNKDYFFRYVNRLDHIYKDITLDAVVCDVDRFHSANKKYGRQFGDHVLRSIGTGLRKLARELGGIGCRQGGDTFLLYCPHQEDYEQRLRIFMEEVFAEKETSEKINLRFGVYTDARQKADVEERFACAKMVADSVKDDKETICAFYKP